MRPLASVLLAVLIAFAIVVAKFVSDAGVDDSAYLEAAIMIQREEWNPIKCKCY